MFSVPAILNKRYLVFYLANMPLFVTETKAAQESCRRFLRQPQDLISLCTKKSSKQLGKLVETIDLQHHCRRTGLTGSRQFVVQVRHPDTAANHKHLFSQLIDHTAKPALRQAPNRDRRRGSVCPASTRQPTPARNENSRDLTQVSAANFLQSPANSYAEALSAAALSPR